MKDEDKREAIELFKREKQEELEKEVPKILQQVDAKILLQFLKGNPNATQLNIINVGRVDANKTNNDTTQMLIESLMREIEELKRQLVKAQDFSLYQFLEQLDEPRDKSLIKIVMSTLMEKFGVQRDAARFYGVSARKWNYMMSVHKIPGYDGKWGY